MIDFRKITVDDRELVQKYTLNSGRLSCDLSFANLCSWSFLYKTEIAEIDGYLLIRFYADGSLSYVMPVGEGDQIKIIELMIDDAESNGEMLRILGVSPEMKADLEVIMPGRFSFEEDRDYYDYIYLREDLVSLSGKKYQSKRNHINKFKRQYPDYEYRELTPELVAECLRMEEEWCLANDCEGQPALTMERCSMTFALNNMEKLGLTGGVLYVEGRIAAFSYGTPINHETWDVCVEKADTNIDGAYAMINNEYANRIDEKYIYINREEDLGIEGLRKAKMSYQPVKLLEKFMAELK
jgi:hypothetical protein